MCNGAAVVDLTMDDTDSDGDGDDTAAAARGSASGDGPSVAAYTCHVDSSLVKDASLTEAQRGKLRMCACRMRPRCVACDNCYRYHGLKVCKGCRCDECNVSHKHRKAVRNHEVTWPTVARASLPCMREVGPSSAATHF